jgi:hypothetical protein
MNTGNEESENTNLPDYFKPILWSYDFSKIDPNKDEKTLIVQAINYGDLKHWRWVTNKFGKSEIKKVLSAIQATEMSPRTRRLAQVIFSIDNFNYAPRGAN